MNDYTDFVALKQNTFKCVFSSVDPKETLQQIIETFAHQAEIRLIRFRATFNREIPAKITTDGARLQQIVRNLLQNAFDNTKTLLEVDVNFSRINGFLHVVITDDGFGIPAEVIKEIYASFKAWNKTSKF